MVISLGTKPQAAFTFHRPQPVCDMGIGFSYEQWTIRNKHAYYTKRKPAYIDKISLDALFRITIVVLAKVENRLLNSPLSRRICKPQLRTSGCKQQGFSLPVASAAISMLCSEWDPYIQSIRQSRGWQNLQTSFHKLQLSFCHINNRVW